MKPKGSHLSYYDLRDAELYDAYKAALPNYAMPDGSTDYWGAIREAVVSPCSRYWISEGMAYSKIRWMLQDPEAVESMVENKKRMYKSLLKVYLKMRSDPALAELSDRQIAYMASDTPAPEFFLTPGSAHIHICAERKRRLMARLNIKK